MNITFLIILFFTSAIVSFGMLHATKFLWKKWWLLDRPHLYKSEIGRAPAPYSIGVMIFLTLLILSPFVYIFGDFSIELQKKFAIILILGAFLTTISFIDDIDTIAKSPIKIPPIFRLVIQILVGAIIGLTSIKISYVSNIFGGIFSLEDPFWQFEIFGQMIHTFPVLVTICWYALIFNSVNFSDGLPWITGGFALISFVILGILAIKLHISDTSVLAQKNSYFILCILAIVIPATLLLTRADIERSVIMGDSGTIMLAFLIATLAIIAGGKIATTISVLGVYVIDAIYVIMRRLRRGQNPMKWDQDSHLHFRLLELGLSKSQVRGIIYFLTTIFGISAILLDTNGKIILLVFIAGITIFLTEILSAVQAKKSQK